MADGKTHAMVSLLAAAPTGLVVGLILGPTAGLGAVQGCLSGIIAGPDQDQQTLVKGEWWIVKYIPVFGWLWMAAWDIYARLIPHRHWLSHLPLVGTALRLAYMAGVGYLVWLARGRPSLPSVPHDYLYGFASGLSVSDTLHWAWDGFCL